jgi:hypothetical protein
MRSIMKPGYKTTEFYLAAGAVLLGGIVAAGAVPSTGPVGQGVGAVVGVLGALGYTVSRAWAKVTPGKGWKSTEYWLSAVAAVVGVLLTSDAFPSTGPVGKVLGMVSTLLAAMGYGIARGIAKGDAAASDIPSPTPTTPASNVWRKPPKVAK